MHRCRRFTPALALMLSLSALGSDGGLAAGNAENARSANTKRELPAIVTSIKPLQLIAGAVTGAPRRVGLLLDPVQSHHHYQLRPSDRRMLAHADVVFWIGPGLEGFLVKPLSALGAGTDVVALAPAANHGQPRNAASDAEHHRVSVDAHVWLDPDRAVAMANTMADVLGRLQPARQEEWRANAERFAKSLAAADQAWQQRFAALGDSALPYLVMHDAYGHFETHYGLRRAATYSEIPDSQPGASHLLALRRLFAGGGVDCVLQEPQYHAGALTNLLADYPDVRVVDLDLMASSVAPAADGFVRFFDAFATAVWQCLRPAGAEAPVLERKATRSLSGE